MREAINCVAVSNPNVFAGCRSLALLCNQHGVVELSKSTPTHCALLAHVARQSLNVLTCWMRTPFIEFWALNPDH